MKGLRSFSAVWDLRVIYREDGGFITTILLDVGSHNQVYRAIRPITRRRGGEPIARDVAADNDGHESLGMNTSTLKLL